MRNVPPQRSASSRGPWALCLILAFTIGCAAMRPADKSLTAALASSKSAANKQNAPLSKPEVQGAVQRIDAARDQAQCDQAVLLWEQDRPAQAQQLLEQVLTRNPQQPLARRLLADMALEQGDTAMAETLLLDLLREFPDDHAARASLAWLYDSLGRTTEASALFEHLEERASPSG